LLFYVYNVLSSSSSRERRKREEKISKHPSPGGISKIETTDTTH